MAACVAWGQPEPPVLVAEAPVTESSGLAASRAREGVWFTHDDSGGKPSIYAFRLDGTYLGEHVIEGASNSDWEDLASGPCPPDPSSPTSVPWGACVYAADIGDNLAKRRFVTVWVIEEPEGGPPRLRLKWDAPYPDGPRDAETLLVDPRSGALHVVTKSRDGRSRVYLLESPGAPMKYVAELSIPGGTSKARRVTGGSWSSGGEMLALRTYTQALV